MRMSKRICRIAAGSFASLLLVFAMSASQPMPVCALGSPTPNCTASNTVLDCNPGETVCCTKTKDTRSATATSCSR